MLVPFSQLMIQKNILSGKLASCNEYCSKRRKGKETKIGRGVAL